MRPYDYRLVLQCTGAGQHRSCELAVLIPVRPRVDLAEMAALGAVVPAPTGEYAEALARGWGVQGSYRVFEPGRELNPPGSKKTPIQLLNLPSGDVAIRLTCPRCSPSQRLHLVRANAVYEEGDRRHLERSKSQNRVALDISDPAATYW